MSPSAILPGMAEKTSQMEAPRPSTSAAPVCVLVFVWSVLGKGRGCSCVKLGGLWLCVWSAAAVSSCSCWCLCVTVCGLWWGGGHLNLIYVGVYMNSRRHTEATYIHKSNPRTLDLVSGGGGAPQKVLGELGVLRVEHLHI